MRGSKHSRDLRKLLSNPIKCSKCGVSGGTLVRVGDGKYVHQDKEKCRILQLRRK